MKSRIARDEVNVEVDSGPSAPELGSILSDLRSQYEDIVKKNKEQGEQWYRRKVGGRRPPSLWHGQKKFKQTRMQIKLELNNLCCVSSWRRCRAR